MTTGEGSTALGFYNVQKGDVPYFTSLVGQFAMSDNFHQSVNGGTGANHIMFGHADAIWFSDGNGHPAVPPENVKVYTACADSANVNPCPNPDAGTVSQIENPNPAPGHQQLVQPRTATATATMPAIPRPTKPNRCMAAARTAIARIHRNRASSRL